ncbi:MAG: hypothetical protein LAP39_12550 [Acidobacteriia bacterium]|nr:hypothetical protein [Terriglobia bacterium]
MAAILLCVVALAVTLWATKRSLGAGVLAVAAVGYAYGILRANLQQTASHFIFDASLTGLYLAYGSRFFKHEDRGRNSALRIWTVLLLVWPCLVCVLPFQPLMVSIVGLRGNIFFLPILVIGSRLKDRDLRTFTFGIALLNLAALGFGIAEYFRGIEPFFPRSAVTSIIYNSVDVAGGHHRIPALFTAAHAYAGTMVCTMPFLFGAWVQRDWRKLPRVILLLGMVAALCGVLMASTRLYFAVALYIVVIATLSSRISMQKRILWILAVIVLGALALSNERFQRFKSLGDSEMVMDRIAGSVNRSFLEVLLEYPMGNGLGGGGTSMPYFLQGAIRNPVGIENDYARILAEQGIIGLSLWIGFVFWCASRRTAFLKHPWLAGRRLIWYWYVLMFISAAIGLGMLTAIPGTFFFLLAIGWTTTEPAAEAPARSKDLRRSGKAPARPAAPVYAG